MLWLLSCTDLPRCNGAIGLCDRPVDEVAFLRSHNAHASEARGYHLAAMNHYLAIPEQLELGVRSLNIDVYLWEEELTACHGFCELGTQPFEEILNEIEAFHADHPDQVVLVDFQDEVGGGAIDEALEASGLRLYRHETGAPWPGLAELRGHTVPIDGQTYGTGWQYDTPEELDCAVQGEAFEHGLYEVTHVLTNPIASPDNAEAINHQPVIGDHVGRCLEEVGFVNLLSVDYVGIGDAVEVVEALNADTATTLR